MTTCNSNMAFNETTIHWRAPLVIKHVQFTHFRTLSAHDMILLLE